MAVPNRNLAFASGATVTSARFFPRPGHTQVTIDVTAFVGDITWTPYAIAEGSGARVALTERALVSAGAADAACIQGTFVALELDVANTNTTAGSFTWSVQEGGN